MLLHMETGGCEGGINLNFIDEVALGCYQSRMYTSDSTDFGFQCPTCSTPFSYMSALLQHAESDACEEDIRDKPLKQFLNYLRSRLSE